MPMQTWARWVLTIVLAMTVASGRLDSQPTTRGSSRQQLMDKLFDPMHGVKMGIPADFCDDGKVSIEVDWDPKSTSEYQCTIEEGSLLQRNDKLYTKPQIEFDPAKHICFPEKINYDTDLPLSGNHRPLWPVFGEYTYLPPQRWVHSLEHGAIVFLYHPCALEEQEEEVEEIKDFLRGCLWKHIISPYRKIPKHMRYAFLSFGRAILFSEFNTETNTETRKRLESFIWNYALTASESHVLEDGQYDAGLEVAAEDYGYYVKDDVLPTCFAERRR